MRNDCTALVFTVLYCYSSIRYDLLLCNTRFSVSPNTQYGVLNLTVMLINAKNFLKDSSTLRERAFFHSLAYISGKSHRIRIFMKILPQNCNLDQGRPR